MEHSPVFLKIRTVAFSVTILICFVWIILLCYLSYARWSISDQSEHTFYVLFLIINVMTVITLPILILNRFRTWLDGARLLLLLICHIGTALAFAAWNPSLQCPHNTSDAQGVCQLLNVYILVASWVAPAFLLAYGTCLGVYAFRRASLPRHTKAVDPECDDEEAQKSQRTDRRATLPMMLPDNLLAPRTTEDLTRNQPSVPSTSRRPSEADALEPSTLEDRQVGDEGSNKGKHTSGRLSKRLPLWYY